MRTIKKIIILILIFPLSAFPAISSVNCNINGDWYAEGLPWYQFHFVQSGSVLLGTSPHPQCNGIIANGNVTQTGANFILTANSKEGYCNYRADVKAAFILFCSAMVWEIAQNGKIEEATFIRIPIKIVEPKSEELIISSEPRMPNLVAKVAPDDPIFLKKRNSDIPMYTWGIKIKHDLGSDLHINAKIDDFKTDSESYQPNFNTLKEIKKDGTIVNLDGGVVGGELTLSVEYYENLHIEKKYSIVKGVNPGQAAIEQVLTDKTLKQIACQESRYKHFNAPREGGVGKLNTKDGSRGGVGIMQLYDPMPAPAEIWNWRKNLDRGIKLYNEKRTTAVKHPIRELSNLNDERAELGLPVCKKPLPPLTEEQLARETLRLYNCGYEYYWEPRNAPNCEGRWVVSPSCEREGKKGYDPDYIDNVLKCDINHYR